MGTLNNRFQYVWYGTCGEQEECKSYVFKENPAQLIDAVEMISSFTTSSANNSPLFYKPEEDEGDLTSLECGGMYCITLRPGKSLNIPGLTAAGSETIKAGENQLASKISFSCGDVFSETPSPTVPECIPESFAKFRINSVSQQIGLLGANQIFALFSVNDQIGIDESYFSAALGTQIDVKFPSGITSQVILTGAKPKDVGGMFYVDRGTGCFGGPYTRGTGDNWIVNLELLSGEDVQPDPEPTPTPKPDVNCDCAPGNYTKVDITGPQTPSSGHVFAGFATGSDVSYDATSLKTEGVACSVDLLFPNGASLGMIIFNTKVPNNTQFFVKRGNVCYTATASSSNRSSSGDWSLTTVVSKNLSSECGDNEVVPDPDPTPTPKQLEPTPTPKPQTTGDCCPDTNRKISTSGTNDLGEVQDTLSGQSKSVTTLKYTTWQNGGELCVDMTDLDGVTPNDSEVFRFYSLSDNPGTAIGAIARVYNNGKNKFYYTTPSGVCYEAEYTEAGQDWQNPVVMQESSIQGSLDSNQGNDYYYPPS